MLCNNTIENTSSLQKLLGVFGTFGCLCYATTHNREHKFSPKTNGISMGYSPNIKGYLILNLEDEIFYISMDVVFREDVFPFNQTTSKIDQNKTENNFPLQKIFNEVLEEHHPKEDGFEIMKTTKNKEILDRPGITGNNQSGQSRIIPINKESDRPDIAEDNQPAQPEITPENQQSDRPDIAENVQPSQSETRTENTLKVALDRPETTESDQSRTIGNNQFELRMTNQHFYLRKSRTK